jgi:hypothetical protein
MKAKDKHGKTALILMKSEDLVAVLRDAGEKKSPAIS